MHPHVKLLLDRKIQLRTDMQIYLHVSHVPYHCFCSIGDLCFYQMIIHV